MRAVDLSHEPTAWPTWPAPGDRLVRSKGWEPGGADRQLVAKNGDLDVLVVWFGTEADQPEDVVQRGNDRGGHASHPGRCPSWLLRAAILYLHRSPYGPLCHSFN